MLHFYLFLMFYEGKEFLIGETTCTTNFTLCAIIALHTIKITLCTTQTYIFILHNINLQYFNLPRVVRKPFFEQG